MKIFEIAILLYILSMGIMYFLSARHGKPIVLPGDILIRKGPRNVYIPIGSAFYVTILLFILFTYFSSKLLPNNP
jgi:hypothetical protein